jgi:hypothetical protein
VYINNVTIVVFSNKTAVSTVEGCGFVRFLTPLSPSTHWQHLLLESISRISRDKELIGQLTIFSYFD